MVARRALALLAVLVTITFQSGCIPAEPGEVSDAVLARLRACEAGGRYDAVNPSGKYRGAYQFDQTTWNSIARRHFPPAVGMDPARAPSWVQDHLARKLWRERGPRPWPECGPRARG